MKHIFYFLLQCDLIQIATYSSEYFPMVRSDMARLQAREASVSHTAADICRTASVAHNTACLVMLDCLKMSSEIIVVRCKVCSWQRK